MQYAGQHLRRRTVGADFLANILEKKKKRKRKKKKKRQKKKKVLRGKYTPYVESF